MKKIFLFLSFTSIFLFCFPENPTGPDKNNKYPGMAFITAQSDSAVLGSNGPSAQTDEKPVSYAKFSYNFYLDTVEVTLRLYRSVMGSIPAEFDTIGPVDDNFPVSYVSWYDAVLFCNARSNLEHLDTVYSYVSIEKTRAGEIYRFSGLRTNFNNHGYRLPTEAEWIYAARGNYKYEYVWGNDPVSDSAARYSWYAHNSDRKPHPVATRQPNFNNLYDLAGSVSEWVNETKVSFNGGTVIDFAGGASLSSTAKIVKGGSYNHDVTYLRVPCRSDVYQVDAASRNRYTGFRCAAGAISNPSYLTKDNKPVNLEPVLPTTGSPLPFLGTNNAVLSFVNFSGRSLHTLCFIDYRVKNPAVYEFTDQTEVYTPSISPDANWVAWANEDEGMSTGGSVFVRRLKPDDTLVILLPDSPAFVPRWFVAPATSDTFIIYVTSSQLNDQASWKSSHTKMIRFNGGTFSGTPEIVVSNGAYHGGRSADGNFLATGSPLLKMKKLSTGEEKTLFYSPYDGKNGDDTSQVCNVSISPGLLSTDRVLFLDFGSGRDTSTLTNTVYHSHEYLFSADFSGKVLNWYQVPYPYYAWNHTEYSNRVKFAVATAATSDGAHRTIYCINLQSAVSTPMCEGTDLYYPSLWVAPETDTFSTDYNLDSVGQYDDPHLSSQQAQLSYKMRLFWHYADSLDMIFIGSSVAADGIDPRYFTGIRGLNMAIGGGDLALSVDLIKNYVLNQCPKLKILGLSYDPHLFFLDGGAGEAYHTFIQGKGYLYDKNHLFWGSGVSSEFHTLINAVTVPPGFGHIDSLGLIPFSCEGYGPTPPPILGDITVSIEQGNYRKNMDLLLETFRLCSLRNIQVLLVNFPTHPGYAATQAYGPLGPSKATARIMLSEIQTEASNNKNLTFYDAFMDGNHDYDESEFFDYLHLCADGARKLSTRIDSILHVMIDD